MTVVELAIYIYRMTDEFSLVRNETGQHKSSCNHASGLAAEDGWYEPGTDHMGDRRSINILLCCAFPLVDNQEKQKAT